MLLFPFPNKVFKKKCIDNAYRIKTFLKTEFRVNFGKKQFLIISNIAMANMYRILIKRHQLIKASSLKSLKTNVQFIM